MGYRFETGKPFSAISNVYNVYYDNEPRTVLVFGYEKLLEKYFICECGPVADDVTERCYYVSDLIPIIVEFIDNIIPCLEKSEVISNIKTFDEKFINEMPDLCLDNIVYYTSYCEERNLEYWFDDAMIDELYHDDFLDIYKFEAYTEDGSQFFDVDEYDDCEEVSENEYIDGVYLEITNYQKWQNYFN